MGNRTATLGLRKPRYGTNVGDENGAEGSNLDLIDGAITALQQQGGGGGGRQLRYATVLHTITSDDAANDGSMFVDAVWDTPFADANYGVLVGVDLTNPAAARWQAAHAYSVNDVCIDSNGHWQICTNSSGVSGDTEPTWPSDSQHTTSDNFVSWTPAQLGAFLGGAFNKKTTGCQAIAFVNSAIVGYVARFTFVGIPAS